MQRLLAGLIFIILLGACAPNVQPLAETSVSALDPSYAQTLVASFYPDLTRLGVTVDEQAAFSYSGADKNASRAVVAQLYEDNEGFCAVRGGSYRLEQRPYVMVLAADGEQAVKGVVYDTTREPMLTYVYFTGRSLRALPVERCR